MLKKHPSSNNKVERQTRELLKTITKVNQIYYLVCHVGLEKDDQKDYYITIVENTKTCLQKRQVY